MAEYTTLDLNVWEDFIDAVTDLRAQELPLRAKSPGVRIPALLFRGQREASWKLETTLERYGTTSLSLLHYYSSIWAAKSQIEAHTGQRWEIEGTREYLERTIDSDAGLFFKAQFPAYDYMAYLRHHGFPSPLLDWSNSPYVAAFFAFRHTGDATGKVAIFAYRETTGAGKFGMVGAPAIDVRGPYVRTHRRHFLQQCQYTVCMAFKDTGAGPQWHYTSHEDVFSTAVGPGLSGQDQLWKFTLPRSERKRVLAYLDEHNLNAYSLFGSDEALMEMMAGRQLLSR
jgi:FRG domain